MADGEPVLALTSGREPRGRRPPRDPGGRLGGPAGDPRGGARRDGVRRGRDAAVRSPGARPHLPGPRTAGVRGGLGGGGNARTPSSGPPRPSSSATTGAEVGRPQGNGPRGENARPERLESRDEHHTVSHGGQMIQLTETAAGKVKELLAEEGRSDIALRVAVQPGGCSGLRYAMYLDDQVDREGRGRGAVRRPRRDRQDERALPVPGQDRLRGLARGLGVHDRQPGRPELLRLRELVPLVRGPDRDPVSGRVERGPHPVPELVELALREDQRGRDLERADPQRAASGSRSPCTRRPRGPGGSASARAPRRRTGPRRARRCRRGPRSTSACSASGASASASVALELERPLAAGPRAP